MKPHNRILGAFSKMFRVVIPVTNSLYSENIRVYQNGSINETKHSVYYAYSNNPEQDNRFVFKYMQIDGNWRAYVLRTPSHKERLWDNFHTHLDPDWGNYCGGARHVDWDTPVKTISDMQKISWRWADLCLRYIETGKQFNA